MILSAKRIRLQADSAKNSHSPMLDLSTSESPEIWRGNAVRFEIAVYFNDVLVDDISNIASMTLEIKDEADLTGDPLVTKTLAADSLTTVTAAAWAAATGQHGLIELSAAETNLALGAASITEKTFHLVVSVITNDSPGKPITLGVSDLTIVEDGTGSAGTPPVNDPLYYTAGESDSRFMPKYQDGAGQVFTNGRWYTYEPTTALWYPDIVVIKDGQPVKTLGPGVTLP